MSLWIIGLLGLYLAVILVIGFLAGRRTRDDAESFYAADRRLNWKQEGLSVFSSAATGAALLGTVGQFYSFKGAFLGYAAGYAVFAPALYWFMGSRLRRLGARYGYQTQSEFLGHFFGSRALSVASSAFAAVVLMVYMAIMPIAVSLAMVKYTGLNYNVGVVLFLVVALSYTLYGGLRAVAQTDVFHGVLLLIFLAMLVVALIWVAGGVSLFTEQSSRQYEFVSGSGSGLLIFLPWAALISISMVCMPDRSQRMFSAKDDRQLSRAVILMSVTLGFSSLVFLFCGMALNRLVPGVSNSDNAILSGLDGHLKWVIPLFMVSVWGASISAASMQMLTVANIFIKELYVPIARKMGGDGSGAKGKRGVQVGRLVMLLTALVALLVSAGQPKAIYAFVGLVLGLFSQFGVLYFLTLFWKRTTRAGAWAGLVVGVGLSLLWQWVLPAPFGMQQPAALALVPNVAVVIGVSLLTPRFARTRSAEEAVDGATGGIVAGIADGGSAPNAVPPSWPSTAGGGAV
jgi:SSS family solute:Na+ symporter